MPPEHEPAGNIPSPQQIRAALDRMLASDIFRRSPQLAAFLRFVVEAVLQGKSDRIKGYTIGVEVLRRDVKFDPQSDPIVRVEATRLRRTLERYYAGPGADDPVLIELPRGSYVPNFAYRAAAVGAAPPADAPTRRAGGAGRAIIRPIAAALAIAAAATLAYLALQKPGASPPVDSGRDLAEATVPAPVLPGAGMPVLLVPPFAVLGSPQPGAIAPTALYEKMLGGFAGFDLINVRRDAKERDAGAAVPAGTTAGLESADNFRLEGSFDYLDDGTTTIRFRLLEEASGTVVWAKAFERVASTQERAAAEDGIIFDLATTLLQPFGVIHSRERRKHLATPDGDPRYRCILEALDALRTFEPGDHARARGCLERLTAFDRSFAAGYAYLAILYNRAALFGPPLSPEDPPLLDLALRTVRHAIELNPESARAHQFLFNILYNRHDLGPAFAAGDRALALNRYDPAILADYGGRLVMTGAVERGLEMLRRSREDGAVRPSWNHFYLFVGNYLTGDLRQAAYHADQITNPNYPLGYLARALAASAAGDSARARQALDRLIALQPAWRDSPRAELARFFPVSAVADRLAKDLAAAGLADRS
jgi:tetratricopeptide (TPR) repeat protein